MAWWWLWMACVTPAEPPAAPGCADCHGSAANPAPPSALGGIEDPGYIGVGAHQIHLAPAGTTKPLNCAACHLFPETLDAPGHIDTPWPAEVAWGDIAKTQGAATPWDREDGTCTVWCHGSDAPAWVGGDAPCGSCHGVPPEAPHPASSSCDVCHGATSTETHVDGIVQLGGGSTPGTTPTTEPPTGSTATTADTGTVTTPEGCDLCHGADGDPSPPPDTSGNTQRSEITVGAHDAHVHGNVFSDGVPCGSCHVVPAATGDAGHIDAAPAEVPFGGLALTDGATPTWDRNGLGTCSGTYCHSGRPGGRTPVPEWTGATDRSCQACHGAPPPSPHPQDSACEGCHGAVAGPGFTLVDLQRHIDGTLDFN